MFLSPFRNPFSNPFPKEGGAAFAPTDVAGLELWLDFSDVSTLFQDAARTTPVTADGDVIGGITDKSGIGNHASQNTAGNKPLYKTNILNSKSICRFDGSNDMLITGSFLDSGYNASMTCFVVSRSSAGASSIDLVLSHNVTTFYFGRNASPARANFNLANISPPQVWKHISQTAWSIDGMVYNGSQYLYRVNAGEIGWWASGDIGASGTITIGAASNGGFPFLGDIAEVIIYNAVLTTAQRYQIESYLSAKYGVSVSLINATKQAIFDGDSMTTGVGASVSYPQQTLDTMGAGWIFANYGAPGQQLTAMIADAATQIDTKYSAAYDKNIVVLWGGTNDLYYGASAATTYSRFVSYCQARQAAGWKVVALTILPRSNEGTPESFESDRQTVNTNIRANWATFADALADVAANTTIGDAGDELNTTYYFDKVHMKDAGYAIVSGIVVTAINGL